MSDKVPQFTTHSVSCNRNKSIMLQRNKSEAGCLLGLEHYFKILPLTEKKTVNSNVLSLNLKLFRTKVDIKSVITDFYLEITLLMSNLLKHANYLNAVLKSLKTRCSWTTNCQGLMHAM